MRPDGRRAVGDELFIERRRSVGRRNSSRELSPARGEPVLHAMDYELEEVCEVDHIVPLAMKDQLARFRALYSGVHLRDTHLEVAGELAEGSTLPSFEERESEQKEQILRAEHSFRYSRFANSERTRGKWLK